jgi:putative pyruvate formate lyase activating enzyme
VCRVGRRAKVSSAFAHFGEEDCLRGWRGSGTIFFSWCNLKCVFCQNWDTSNEGEGRELDAPELASLMLGLQEQGCHNINFVSPEHVVPQMLEALPIAIERGLRLPIVYNTSAYDSLHSLRLLDGVVDIYMPDFKYWSAAPSARYLKAKDYPEVARQAIREMHRQVGDLVVDSEGLARRGLLVRHLVMPDGLDETARIVDWIASELSPDTYVNVMGQYYPAGKVVLEPERYPELLRDLRPAEHADALSRARSAGLRRLDVRNPHPSLRRRLAVLF